MSNIIFKSLIISFVIFLTVAVISQILLLIPSVGGSLPASGVVEFERIESPTGQILIKLKEGYQPSGNIKVLVNGNDAASLSAQSIELTVMNNSVIEIDGRRVGYPFEVTVAPLDGAVCDGDYATVDGNLVRLTRVFAGNN